MDTNVDDVIKRIEDWKDKDIKYEILDGGITNHNYKVFVNDELFVVRIPGAATDLLINRDNELDCSSKAGKVGVAPELVYHLKPENISVSRFIQGKTLHPEEIAGSNELIQHLVKAVKNIHEKAVFKSPFNPFDTIRTYMHYIKEYNAPRPNDIDRMLSVANDIEKAMERSKTKCVACHNDLLSENFLDDGTKIWIVDWEYGGQGDPYFDLSDFAMEHPFTREQEELIIKEYCGEMKYERLYRMLLHKTIAALWWGIWAMIQSKISRIDFDFYAWGNERFERSRRSARDKDFKKWLDGV